MICLMLLVTLPHAEAQYDPIKKCVVDANGECLPNTILSAVPFLRIVPDARSGAMGDVGIATSVDPNALYHNASKLAFIENNVGFSASYTPWLRDLGLNDVYLTYLSGYKQIDELQSLGFGLTFFSLGEINFTDEQGNPAGQGKPRELALSFAYARKLSSNFSASLTGKYIYSNLASGQQVQGIDISSANAFAADIAMFYRKDIQLSGYESEWSFGTTISNIGSKVTYTDNVDKDFLPMNLGIGTALKLNFDNYNSLAFALDINKLLIPTPIPVGHEDYDTDSSGIPDYREKGIFSAMLGSFSDAPGGFSEELKELSYSFGVEYWYDNQFAVRTGYYYENALKGDRQFLTVGIGLKYNVFGINLSYLVPTNNRRNPLDNTLRFTLNFNLDDTSGS